MTPASANLENRLLAGKAERTILNPDSNSGQSDIHGVAVRKRAAN
jgi:hypothetical protein